MVSRPLSPSQTVGTSDMRTANQGVQLLCVGGGNFLVEFDGVTNVT